MEHYIIIATLVLVLVLAILAIFISKRNALEKENKRTGKYPEGHYMNMGIALGIPLGFPIGLLLDNIAIGPAFGMAIGVAIGSYLENKHKDELRPLTQEEKERKKKIIYLLLGTLVLGAIAFITFILL